MATSKIQGDAFYKINYNLPLKKRGRFFNNILEISEKNNILIFFEVGCCAKWC